MVPVPPAATVKAVVQAREAAVKPAGVKSTAVETAAVEPAKSATVETAAVEPPAVETPAVETPSAAMESAAATVRCVGEIRLAENGRAQQRSCNADHTPPVAGPGSAIA
jgi:hypothetical protein